MYKLYYSPAACSLAIHVILREINAKFEAINTSLQEGKNRSPEFLKINPRGNVPVLVDNGAVIREGAAIILHLLDNNANTLLPKAGLERTRAIEWLMFANSTLHANYSKAFTVARAVPEGDAQQQAFKAIGDMIQKNWDELDATLATQQFLCGSQISPADILVTVIAHWDVWLPQLSIKLGKNVQRLVNEVVARPAYQQALAAEQVTYQKAA